MGGVGCREGVVGEVMGGLRASFSGGSDGGAGYVVGAKDDCEGVISGLGSGDGEAGAAVEMRERVPVVGLQK